jgi:hypothetical protein
MRERDSRRAFRAEDTPPEWVKALGAADYSHLPESIDLGPISHTERNKILFGIDEPCECPKCAG